MPRKRKAQKKATKKGRSKVRPIARKKLTDSALEEALWNSIQGLQDGSVEPDEAMAVSLTAKEIIRLQRTKLDIMRLGLKDSRKIKLIG